MKTDYSLKKTLLLFHVICGVILAINLISSYTEYFTLYFSYSQIIKYCFLISGAILFFLVKNLKAYFSVYTFSPIVALVSLLFGFAGIFVVCIMANFIWQKSMIANSNNYILYAKFSGFMKVPDEFELTESKNLIFEKKVVEFKDTENNEDLKNCKINVVNDSVQILFTKENRNYVTDKLTTIDTIMKIAIK